MPVPALRGGGWSQGPGVRAASLLHSLVGLGLSLMLQPVASQTWRLDAEVSRARYLSIESPPGASGFELNRDEGWLTRARLGTEMDAGHGGWLLHGALGQGAVDYTGFTQWGVPLETSSRILEQSLTVGGWLATPLPAGLSGRIGLEVEQQCIRRDIQPTARSSRLTETLCSQVLGLGGRMGWNLLEGWSAEVSMRWARPWRQSLQADAHGVLDEFKLSPRHMRQQRSEISLLRHFEARSVLVMTLRRHDRNYGASAPTLVTRQGLPSGFASYPGSRLRQSEIALAWRLDFGR